MLKHFHFMRTVAYTIAHKSKCLNQWEKQTDGDIVRKFFSFSRAQVQHYELKILSNNGLNCLQENRNVCVRV